MRKTIGPLALALAVCLLAAACSPDPGQGRQTQPKQLPDPRFNGDFVWEQVVSKSEDHLRRGFEILSFDGTSKSSQYAVFTDYVHNGTEWVESDRNEYFFTHEIEVDPSRSMMRQRQWGNPLSQWRDWYVYGFSDNGDTLRTYEYGMDNPTDYRKR